MKKLIQMTSEGASQVENLCEVIQIEDLICQGELDYVERQMQMEDLLCVAEAEAIERQMQMEDILCAAEAETIERQIQMGNLLSHVGYGWS